MISPSKLHAQLVADLERTYVATCTHPIAESLREPSRGRLECSECSAPVLPRAGGPK